MPVYVCECACIWVCMCVYVCQCAYSGAPLAHMQMSVDNLQESFSPSVVWVPDVWLWALGLVTNAFTCWPFRSYLMSNNKSSDFTRLRGAEAGDLLSKWCLPLQVWCCVIIRWVLIHHSRGWTPPQKAKQPPVQTGKTIHTQSRVFFSTDVVIRPETRLVFKLTVSLAAAELIPLWQALVYSGRVSTQPSHWSVSTQAVRLPALFPSSSKETHKTQ